MKKLMLLMLVLFSLPSMAQSNLMEDSLSAVSDVVVDTLEVLNVEPVQNINYLTINADQQGSMIYVNDEFAGFDTVTKLLNVGETYSWRVECDMYHNESGDVTIVSGDAVIIDVEMKPAYGFLTVTSLPEDSALVYVDNKYVGITPNEMIHVGIGKHKMLVYKEMYDPYIYEFEVEGNDTVMLEVQLVSNSKNVMVTTDSQSDIYIDNVMMGVGDWNGSITYGAHIIEAKKNNHKPVLLETYIHNDSIDSIDTIVLEAPVPICGSLDVLTSPQGASVFIDGVNRGTTPLFIDKMLIGQYELCLVKDGCADMIKTIDIVENDTLSIDEVFSPAKEILVKTDRYGDSLFVNDRYVGKSPHKLFLTYNTHNIKARRMQYEVSDDFYIDMNDSVVELFVGKEIQIVTDYKRDRIFIDGKEVGVNPCQTMLSYGEHNLRVMRGKYRHEQTIVVEDDNVDVIEITLGKEVSIKTTNKGDKVYIDNKYAGKTPLTKYIYYGEHDVKVVRGDHETTQTISVNDNGEQDEHTIYIGQLVTFESTRHGDDIYINGEKKGESPLVYDMPVGNHEVMAKRHRRMDVQRIYIIKDGQTHFNFTPTKESISEFNSNGMGFFTLNASQYQGKYSYGLSWGSYKKVGWYISLLTNFDPAHGTYQTGITQFITKHNDYSPDLKAEDFNNNHIDSRLSATAGLMFKVAGPVYLKLGGGYALYSAFDQTINEEWYRTKDGNYNGLLLTGGLQFNLKNIVISTDVNTNQNFDFMEFKLGIGFAKKKNKDKK